MRLQDIKRYIVRLYVLLQPNGTDKYKCQFGKIEIHSNVFVRAGATIMYNVTIGENVIVAPGAIVKKMCQAEQSLEGYQLRLLEVLKHPEEKQKNSVVL